MFVARKRSSTEHLRGLYSGLYNKEGTVNNISMPIKKKVETLDIDFSSILAESTSTPRASFKLSNISKFNNLNRGGGEICNVLVVASSVLPMHTSGVVSIIAVLRVCLVYNEFSLYGRFCLYCWKPMGFWKV